MKPDYLIVGTGLTGATIARALSDAGRSVLAVERRPRVGGNVADYTHPSGIRVQRYGPHYFRTSSDRIWKFVQRFSAFYRYEARVLTHVDGCYENWPVSGAYIRRRVGPFCPRPIAPKATDFEAAVLSMMPREVYVRFVRDYTEKQWGVAPHTLHRDLAKRVQIRWDDDPRLTPRARYQGLPTDGYTAFVRRMLGSVPVVTNVDYLEDRKQLRPRQKVVYTGPIDEYFGFTLGRLAYRGQRRETTYTPEADFLQPAAQVNTPQHASGAHIRRMEWKHLMPRAAAVRVAGTVITTETPFSPGDPDHCEYPFPDEANQALYARYRSLAKKERDVLICGRLGEYRYYDMDQAIARALLLAKRMLNEGSCPRQTDRSVGPAVSLT